MFENRALKKIGYLDQRGMRWQKTELEKTA
jgi:hypothetical protein